MIYKVEMRTIPGLTMQNYFDKIGELGLQPAYSDTRIQPGDILDFGETRGFVIRKITKEEFNIRQLLLKFDPYPYEDCNTYIVSLD